jgi:hypothetical protein
MWELARRLALAGGAITAAWMWFTTVPLVYSVRPSGFRAEYAKKYGPAAKEGPALGAIGAAKRFLAQHTDPGTVEAYIERTMENRTIRNSAQLGPPLWERWERARREGRDPRLADGALYFLPGEAEVAAAAPEMRKIRAVWLNGYLPFEMNGETRYLEFMTHPEPKDSAAPRSLIHPLRDEAWRWMLAGLLIYLAPPWRKLGEKAVGYDRAVIRGLDAVGLLTAAFFAALPLAVADSNEELWSEGLGLLGICAVPALLAGVLLMMSAHRAAFRILVEEEGLRVEGLAGGVMIPYASLRRASVVGDGFEDHSLRLEDMQGGRWTWRWVELLWFERVLEALSQRQIRIARTHAPR